MKAVGRKPETEAAEPLQKPQSKEAFRNLFNCFYALGMQAPDGSHPTRSFYWRRIYGYFSAVMYVWQLVLVPTCFVISYRYMGDMDMTQILTSIQVAIDAVILPAKIVALAWNLKLLRRSEIHLAHLDGRCSDPEEFHMISEAARFCNRLVWFYQICYAIYSSSTFLSSFLLGQPPYALYLPGLDWRRSKLQFCIQAWIEFFIMNWTCLHQASDDVYAVIYLYVVRVQVQLLARRVHNLGSEDAEDTCLDERRQEQHCQELQNCIVDHQTILKLLGCISPVISRTIFVQFLITAAIMGTTMINIFIFANTNTKIASIIYLMAVTLQTAPCCYQATSLRLDNELLALAICQCRWQGQSPRFRKMLLFYLHHAQQPITLTAMKLFPINLATYFSIAKFSFSLYTLIKGMNLGERFTKNK